MNLRNYFMLFGLTGLITAAGCAEPGAAPAETTATAPEEEATEGEAAVAETAEPAEESTEQPAETTEVAAVEEEAAPESEPAAEPVTADDANVVTFKPGPDAQKEILEELILAEPGTVFQFEEGTFDFTDGLSLTVDNVTIRGRGMDKTILNFKNQEAGAEGLYITSDNVLVEGLAIVDTKGNASKSLKANNIVYRDVKAEWTGGPLSTNGAYGFYPVSSKNVTVDGCVAIGASDAGIYVGQSINVIVKNCRAEYNVAGIEIENCYDAEVFNCEATNNTGGILVFDLPDLPQQRGHNVRVYDNHVHDNNTANFAPEGNIVGKVPAGTGIEIMANSNVEVFNNKVFNHGTNSVIIISYLASGKEIKDPDYYPYAEGIHIHHNEFNDGGQKPDNDGGKLMEAILGKPLPNIVWDGIVNEDNMVDGKLPAKFGISIHDNTNKDGEVTFGNLGGLPAVADPANAKPSRDLTPHREPLPSLEPIKIAGVQK